MTIAHLKAELFEVSGFDVYRIGFGECIHSTVMFNW